MHKFSSAAEDRRHRVHELVLALIAQQGELELLDGEALIAGGGSTGRELSRDPASWLDRNRRVMARYQALVRSAVTLDALIDQEAGTGHCTGPGPC